jgi:hypothetical protein
MVRYVSGKGSHLSSMGFEVDPMSDEEVPSANSKLRVFCASQT